MNQIFQRVEADLALSVTDLKKNPAAAFEAAETQAVAVLNHNRVVGYIVSPVAWEGMLEALDDLHIIGRLEKSRNEPRTEVSADELSGPIRRKRPQKLEQARGDSSTAVRKDTASARRKSARPRGPSSRKG
jgi:antitoxin StbD